MHTIESYFRLVQVPPLGRESLITLHQNEAIFFAGLGYYGIEQSIEPYPNGETLSMITPRTFTHLHLISNL